MAVFEVAAPNGDVYRIEAPDNTSDKDLSSATYRQYYLDEAERLEKERETLLDSLYKVEAQKEEGSLLGDILQSPFAGAVGLYESAALGAVAPLDEGAESSARDVIKSVADFVRPEISNPDNVAVKLGQGLGSLLALAPALAAGPGALPIIAGLSVGAGAGEASERAREFGATVEERGEAALLGTIPGSFDILPIGRLARAAGVDIGDIPFVGDMLNKLGPQTVEGATNKIQRALVSGGVEGAQEAAQNVAQNLIAQGYDPDAATFGGTLEEGLIGGGVGAIAQGLLDLVLGGRRARGPDSGPQGELFPDDDLGVKVPSSVPLNLSPAQGELFPDDNLGVGPEEDTQLDLFGPAGSREAALRREVRNREVDREEVFQTPIGREDRAEEPIFEESKTRLDDSRRQLAELERQKREEQEAEQSSFDIEGAVLDRKEAELLGSIPTDVSTELARASESAPTTPLAIAAQEAVAKKEQEQAAVRIAEEETRAAEEEIVRQQTEAEIAIREGTAQPEVAPEITPEVAPEITPTQGALPGLSRSYGEKTQQARIDNRPTPTPEPRIVGEEELNQLQIPKTAPIRKRVIGKDFNNPEVRQDLATFAGAKKTSQQVKSNINRLLTAVSSEQVDIFNTKGLRAAPTTSVSPEVAPAIPAQVEGLSAAQSTSVSPEQIIPQTEVIENDELNVFGTNISATDADTRRSRRRPKSSRSKPKLVSDPIQSPTPPTSPAAGRLGASATNVVGAIRGEEPAPTTVESGITQEAADFLVSAERGMPTSINNNLRRIAEANLISALKTKAVKKAPVKKAPVKKTPVKKPTETKAPAKPATVKPVPTRAPLVVSVKAEPRSKEDVAKIKAKEEQRGSIMLPATEGRLLSGNVIIDTEVDSKNFLTAEDNNKINDIESGETSTSTRDKEQLALKSYMKLGTPFDAIYSAIFDVVHQTPRFTGREKGLSKEYKAMYVGTGKQSAERVLDWAEKNLSDQAKAWIAKEQARATEANNQAIFNEKNDISPIDVMNTPNANELASRVSDIKELEDSLKTANAEAATELRKELRALNDEMQNLLLKADAVVGLDIPIHPAVRTALNKGNLVEVLSLLASTSPSTRVSQIAGTLIKVAGTTKIEIVKNLKGADGTVVAGLFDPKTNTIKLNAEIGVNPHSILHETTHAAVSATLANKSHPVTKQLTKLYEDVKGSLNTYYGSESVDEFVSETFSNPEFQQQLAMLKPTGTQISALQRFFNTVGNFVRRMLGMQTRPINSALNEADKLIKGILAPSPKSRNAGEMYLTTPKAIEDMIKGVHDRVKSSSTDKDKLTFIQRIQDFYDRGASALSRRGILYALPLQAVRDIAAKYKLNAAPLQEAIDLQAGATSTADAKVDAVLGVFDTWLNKHQNLKETFDRVVYTSTIKGVDPSDNRSVYEGDADKLAVFDKMRKDWKALKDNGGDKIYTEMRDVYTKIYADMKAEVSGQMDALASSSEDRTRFKGIYERMFDTKTKKPYFPLTRTGDLWIRYDAFNENTNTTEPVYEAFSTIARRNERMKELDSDPRVKTKPKTYESINDINFQNAPSNSFMKDVLDVLDSNRPVDPKEIEAHAAQKDQLMRLFIESLPETSFAKSMQQRGDFEGYTVDAFGAFRDKAYSLNRQVQQLKSSNAIRREEDKLKEAWKRNEDAGVVDSATAKLILNELLERAKFARNPPADTKNRIAAQANRIAFLGTIGFNISSAVVNASQIPLVMMPLLNGRYRKTLGGMAATKAIGNASRLITGSGTSRKMSRVDQTLDNIDAKGTPSIDNYYEFDKDGVFIVRKDLKLDKAKIEELERLKPLVDMANKRGLLTRSLFFDTLGIDSSGRNRSSWDTANAWGAFAFHSIERYNRQISLISSYDLELQRMEKDGEAINAESMDKAANEAIYMTQEMNGGATLTTTGRIAQQGIGRVAMMYKSFGTQMYYTLFKTGAIALNNMKTSGKHTPEEIRIAREQFFGVLVSSALLAGVQGMPLVGVVLMMANLFLDEDEDDAETILRKRIGELAYKGPLNAITGTDVASRISLSNLIYRDNPYNSDASDAEKMVEILGGPAWSVISQFKRGLTDVMTEDGNTERGVESMMPAAFRNIYKGLYRYPRDEGILTRRGDPIVDDITAGGMLAQVIGFAPTEYTLKQEQNQALKRIDRVTNKKRTKILRQYYIDIRMGGDGADALERIRQFNKRHPNAAISYSTVKKSMKQHARTSATMHNGVTISRNMRGIAKEHVDAYTSGFGFLDDD